MENRLLRGRGSVDEETLMFVYTPVFVDGNV